MANRQYGKALPFFIRLRRPNVFDLIRDHNLFTSVQDQALLLVEFDHELVEKRHKNGDESADFERGAAITLLVDHIHSIPVSQHGLSCGLDPDLWFMSTDRKSCAAATGSSVLPLRVSGRTVCQGSSPYFWFR